MQDSSPFRWLEDRGPARCAFLPVTGHLSEIARLPDGVGSASLSEQSLVSSREISPLHLKTDLATALNQACV
jgi:hypothetical protein